MGDKYGNEYILQLPMELSSYRGGKISRIDELLSRNELIYQNLRDKLNDITESSNKIKHNIDSIKPYTNQEQNNQQHSSPKENTHQEHSLKENKHQSTNEEHTASKFQHALTKQVSNSHHHMPQFSKVTQCQNRSPTNNRWSPSENRWSPRSNQCHTNPKWEPNITFSEDQNRYSQYQEALESGHPHLAPQIPPQVHSEMLYEQIQSQFLQQRTFQEEFIHEELMHKELVHKELMHKELMHKELMHEELLHEELVQQKMQQQMHKQQLQQQMQHKRHLHQQMNHQINHKHQVQQEQQQHQVQQQIHQKQINQEMEQQVRPSTDSQPLQTHREDEISEQQEMSQQRTEDISQEVVVNCKYTQQAFVLIPFNKLYRSPILQLVSPSTLILARPSKLSPINRQANNKLLDGIKYKVRNVFTDEDHLIKALFGPHLQSVRVALVGSHHTLKRKMHMQLIAQSHSRLLTLLQKHDQVLVCSLYHEQVSPNNEPDSLQISVEIPANDRKCSILEIQACIEAIYECMSAQQRTKHLDKCKRNDKNKDSEKDLRVTRILLFGGKQQLWESHIISTTKQSLGFIQCLQVQQVVWCINPLLQNYQPTAESLSSLKKFLQS